MPQNSPSVDIGILRRAKVLISVSQAAAKTSDIKKAT